MIPSYAGLLRALTDAEVEFIVIGGVAAILEGAPISTLDLDVLYSREPANLERLLRALEHLEARYNRPRGRLVRPSRERLESFRVHLLLTRFGPLDLLAVTGATATYEDLLPFTHLRAVGGTSIRVLDLAKLIEVKEAVGRDKDLAMLPLLKRTLELRRG